MTSVSNLHTATATLLKQIPNVTVYDDGVVPSKPPAGNDGRVHPYIVMWPTPGFWPEDEAASVCGTPGGELNWSVQLNVVGGTVTWVLKTADLVRAALLGVEPLPGAGPLKEDIVAVNIQPDPETTPTRYYVPMFFGCLTA